MSNQLEKLKKSIKKEYTKSFELNLMKSSGFIPVDKRQTEFYVILNKSCVANKSKIEALFNEKYAGFTLKFIPVEAGDFEALFATLAVTPPKTLPVFIFITPNPINPFKAPFAFPAAAGRLPDSVGHPERKNRPCRSASCGREFRSGSVHPCAAKWIQAEFAARCPAAFRRR